jgi:hypothetical protein
VPEEYHPPDNPEKGVGLHYSLFTPLTDSRVFGNSRLTRRKKLLRGSNPLSRANNVLSTRFVKLFKFSISISFFHISPHLDFFMNRPPQWYYFF